MSHIVYRRTSRPSVVGWLRTRSIREARQKARQEKRQECWRKGVKDQGGPQDENPGEVTGFSERTGVLASRRMQRSLKPVYAVLSTILIAAFLVACSAEKSRRSSDPFDDPFFHSGFAGESGLDSFLSEPSPSVGWLSEGGEQSPEERLIREHGDPIWGDSYDQPESDLTSNKKDRPFMEKAQEATMATMSVLVGVGMAALPFLLAAL